MSVASHQVRHRIDVAGVVQGVGFRPHVASLAHGLGLHGWVRNTDHGVQIEVQGSPRSLAQFGADLVNLAPPLARVEGMNCAALDPTSLPISATAARFTIEPSSSGTSGCAAIPPDTATCDACLAELLDPSDRRFRHAFITCTDCGPRWTIVTGLPYDRPRTTMGRFEMCATCTEEYQDLSGRRHHAQPIACLDCGPRLSYSSGVTSAGETTSDDEVISASQADLAAGRIVAIKGIGGFHLVVDATNDPAVARLRRKKHRPNKPFAIMVRDLASARNLAMISFEEERALTDPARPIVLLRVRDRAGAVISEHVAPNSPLIGIMLPYSPLHHLLFRAAPGDRTEPPQALVVTSGNLAGEPIVHRNSDATAKLAAIADSFCMHDREIATPCDDSIVRIIDGLESPIRRSRGYAPLSISLPFAVPPLLAVGADLKNTCCIASGHRALLSQHLGDMASLASHDALAQAVDGLTALHAITPSVVVTDRHPDYQTSRIARRYQLPLHAVGHHHAHLAAVLAEHQVDPTTRVIGCLFDGTGWGDDDTLWGGEILIGGYDRADRAAHLRPTPLPGGDAAVKNPWRMALAHLAGAHVDPTGLACSTQGTDEELLVVNHQISTGFASPRTTSMGRLFDAVASLLNVRHHIHYEAQAAIELEALATSADTKADGLVFGIDCSHIAKATVIDPRPLVRAMADQIRAGVDGASLALGFHHAVATAVVVHAREIRRGDPQLSTVALSGGVFQNHLLTALTTSGLRGNGFRVLTHRRVPANDGGLSLGQAAVAGFRMSREHTEGVNH